MVPSGRGRAALTSNTAAAAAAPAATAQRATAAATAAAAAAVAATTATDGRYPGVVRHNALSPMPMEMSVGVAGPKITLAGVGVAHTKGEAAAAAVAATDTAAVGASADGGGRGGWGQESMVDAKGTMGVGGGGGEGQRLACRGDDGGSIMHRMVGASSSSFTSSLSFSSVSSTTSFGREDCVGVSKEREGGEEGMGDGLERRGRKRCGSVGSPSGRRFRKGDQHGNRDDYNPVGVVVDADPDYAGTHCGGGDGFGDRGDGSGNGDSGEEHKLSELGHLSCPRDSGSANYVAIRHQNQQLQRQQQQQQGRLQWQEGAQDDTTSASTGFTERSSPRYAAAAATTHKQHGSLDSSDNVLRSRDIPRLQRRGPVTSPWPWHSPVSSMGSTSGSCMDDSSSSGGSNGSSMIGNNGSSTAGNISGNSISGSSGSGRWPQAPLGASCFFSSHPSDIEYAPTAAAASDTTGNARYSHGNSHGHNHRHNNNHPEELYSARPGGVAGDTNSSSRGGDNVGGSGGGVSRDDNRGASYLAPRSNRFLYAGISSSGGSGGSSCSGGSVNYSTGNSSLSVSVGSSNCSSGVNGSGDGGRGGGEPGDAAAVRVAFFAGGVGDDSRDGDGYKYDAIEEPVRVAAADGRWGEEEGQRGRKGCDRGEGRGGRKRVGGMARTENVLVSRQLPNVDKSPVSSEGTTVVSFNSHLRVGLPKLRSILAMCGGSGGGDGGAAGGRNNGNERVLSSSPHPQCPSAFQGRMVGRGGSSGGDRGGGGDCHRSWVENSSNGDGNGSGNGNRNSGDGNVSRSSNGIRSGNGNGEDDRSNGSDDHDGGGGACWSGGNTHPTSGGVGDDEGKTGSWPTPTGSSIVTIHGPNERLAKYQGGVGSLGPTLETLEPHRRTHLLLAARNRA